MMVYLVEFVDVLVIFEKEVLMFFGKEELVVF